MDRIEGQWKATQRIWEDFPAGIDAKIEDCNTSPGRSPYFGVVSFPQAWRESGFYYLAGLYQDHGGSSNPTLITKELPAGTYARFSFVAKPSELPLILEYIFQTWLPKSGKDSDIPFVVLSYGSRPLPGNEIEQQAAVPLD
jgi:DNA gyrase inhibitor GyrI